MLIHVLSFKLHTSVYISLPRCCFIFQYDTNDCYSFIFSLFDCVWMSLTNPSYLCLTKLNVSKPSFSIVHHLGFLPNYHSLGFLPATCNSILTIHVFPLTESYTIILLYFKAFCLSYFLYQIPFCCCICCPPWASYVLLIKLSLNFINDFPFFFHTPYFNRI